MRACVLSAGMLILLDFSIEQGGEFLYIYILFLSDRIDIDVHRAGVK